MQHCDIGVVVNLFCNDMFQVWVNCDGNYRMGWTWVWISAWVLWVCFVLSLRHVGVMYADSNASKTASNFVSINPPIKSCRVTKYLMKLTKPSRPYWPRWSISLEDSFIWWSPQLNACFIIRFNKSSQSSTSGCMQLKGLPPNSWRRYSGVAGSSVFSICSIPFQILDRSPIVIGQASAASSDAIDLPGRLPLEDGPDGSGTAS